MFNDKVYTLFPEGRVLLDMMLRNVLVYDVCRRGSSISDSSKKRVTSGEDLGVCVDDECVHNYKKYSELADINHIMK